MKKFWFAIIIFVILCVSLKFGGLNFMFALALTIIICKLQRIAIGIKKLRK